MNLAARLRLATRDGSPRDRDLTDLRSCPRKADAMVISFRTHLDLSLLQGDLALSGAAEA
jgi:hypothetical protein